MTHTDEIGQGEQNETPQMTQLRQQLRKAEQEAKDNADKAGRADKAERELAFAKSGIDLSDTKMQYFIKGYEGDLTPEAITEAAKAAGFITEKSQEQPAGQTDGAPAPPAVPNAEVQALSQMEAVTHGTELPGDQGADFARIMNDVYSKGGSSDDVARALGAAGYPVSDGY